LISPSGSLDGAPLNVTANGAGPVVLGPMVNPATGNLLNKAQLARASTNTVIPTTQLRRISVRVDVFRTPRFTFGLLQRSQRGMMPAQH
jgi:hypothetical protein